MARVGAVLLVAEALWELLRYDLLNRLGGFAQVRRSLRNPPARGRLGSPERQADVCRAMDLAICLYWKQVMCLQRSVAMVRLLRKRRLNARLVVGCRPEPFLSHAWVELEGLVINDSPLYKKQLPVLMQL